MTRRTAIFAAVALLAMARSALFVFRPESYFDSDQAVFGLMAKHLAEGRAFPLFMYGQNYLLGVESWLAAPLFVVFGSSAVLLKLPLLLMNGAAAVLLVAALERDARLPIGEAVAAALPFVLPAVALAAVFVEPSGGNLEPYLYVLLLWWLRHRPIPSGVVLGIGFMQRAFTVYGFLALVFVEAFDRSLFTRPVARRRALTLAIAAGVWLGVQAIRPLSTGSGPGTSVERLAGAPNDILELARRSCVSPATAATGAGRLFSTHWPALLGTAPYPLAQFGIESAMTQGLSGTSWLPGAAVMIAIAGIVIGRRTRAPVPRFPVFLILVGVFSVTGYVLGRCGEVNFFGMRYELLSPLAIAGLSAWFLTVKPGSVLKGTWTAVTIAWLLVVAVPHVRLLAEYARHPPAPAKHQLIDVLESGGVRYGTADYWLAYYISFMTGERMIFASSDIARLTSYDAIVEAHKAEAVRLSRTPCSGGVALIPGVYRCP